MTKWPVMCQEDQGSVVYRNVKITQRKQPRIPPVSLAGVLKLVAEGRKHLGVSGGLGQVHELFGILFHVV